MSDTCDHKTQDTGHRKREGGKEMVMESNEILLPVEQLICFPSLQKEEREERIMATLDPMVMVTIIDTSSFSLPSLFCFLYCSN